MPSTEVTRDFLATSWVNLNTTDNDDVKIRYYPRIAVLQDIIKSGAPITQAILNEIYDMAYNLAIHKHKYKDVTWNSTGNTSPYPDTDHEWWTDIPKQYNNLVPLGSPLMQGVIFEKWYLCPYVPNILVLDSAPLIYTRQYKLPSDGIVYFRDGGVNIPSHLQKEGLGLIVDFYLDTTADIGLNRKIKISVKDSANVIVDNRGYFCNIGETEITFNAKNTMTHFQLQWIEGTGSQPYVKMEFNGALIPTNKIYSLTPQVSLNTTVTDASIASIYALYQLVQVLCNHSHPYLDFDVYKDDKFHSASVSKRTAEAVNVTSNEQVKFTAEYVSYQWFDSEDGINTNAYYTGDIKDVSMFSNPVQL